MSCKLRDVGILHINESLPFFSPTESPLFRKSPITSREFVVFVGVEFKNDSVKV